MTVFLVGAGPGDPGLLTVRGAELLGEAEVVVYDRLVHPSILELVAPGAERIYVGKQPGRAELGQEGINALLVEHGQLGATVVRLKGGDPFVFGRGGEEAEALRDAGIAFEVVPGITSAIGGPAYAGIPVTHRGLSTHFTVVTGHEDPGKGTTDVDWEALARAGGTLVILMGVGRVEAIAGALMAGGRAASTPAAVVRWATRPDQRSTRTTLGSLAEVPLEPPSVIVVGEVAGIDLSWFESRPLFGRRVVVTRAREQASDLRLRLEALGAEVIELPSIRIEPIDFDPGDPRHFAWIVFTSPNGVEAYFEGLARLGEDARAFARSKIAAIGPGTAAALVTRGIQPDLVPAKFVAEQLLEEFPLPHRDAPKRLLLARAEEARELLPEGLAELGYAVDVLAVYRTVVAEADPAALERVRAGEPDVITFTSSSTVRNFCGALGSLSEPLPDVVCIGPVTAATARELGLQVTAVAEEHTIDGLVGAVLDLLAGR